MSAPAVGLVRVVDVDFHPFNAGRNLGDLRALTESIRQRGLIHPVVVERRGNRLRLRAGHRRLAAAKIAGLARIPAVIHPEPLTDADWLLNMAEENSLRKDLDRAERRLFVEKMRNLGVPWDGVAAAFGVSISTAQAWGSPAPTTPRTRRAPRTLSLRRVERIASLARKDPNATAETILDALEELIAEAKRPRRTLRRTADVVEDCELLAETGGTWESALSRIGMERDALERALYRAARGDLVTRLKAAS